MTTFTGNANGNLALAVATDGNAAQVSGGFSGGVLADLQDLVGDVINGNGGNDTIIAGNAADTINGGDGDDFLGGSGGADTIDGGVGFDEVRYDRDSAMGGGAGVTVNLVTGKATDGFGATDTLSNIESIRGTNFADTLTGGLAANDGFEGYRGLGGNDIITGGSGYDEVRYDLDAVNGGAAGVTVNLGTGTATDGFGNTDTLSGIEGVRGSRAADKLTGSSAGNILVGLAGDDILDGGDGTDDVRYERDAITQNASAAFGTAGVTVNLVTGKATDGYGNTDTLISIENVRATRAIDNLTGNAEDNFFWGLAGADTIDGGDGFDGVSYNVDADFANASNVFGTAGVTVNLETGSATDGYGDTDKLSGIQGVMGTSQVDTLTGKNFLAIYGEQFRGLAGNDVIDGGTGYDEVRYDSDAVNDGKAAVIVNLSGASQTATINTGTFNVAAGRARDGFGNTDTLANIENARGTALADVFFGADNMSERFSGFAGNDTMTGGGGLFGTDTADYRFDVDYGGKNGVIVNLSTSSINATIAAGTFLVAAGTARDGFGDTDTLIGMEGARGTNEIDVMVGGAADDVFQGFGGNDTITGGAGAEDAVRYDAEFLEGGKDGVIVNLSATTQNATIAAGNFNVAANQARDASGATDTLSGIEVVRGTRLADAFFGRAADEIFQGLNGNDLINGGGGSDWVSYGADIFAREESQSVVSVTVDLAAGTAIDSFGNSDTLVSIENASGTHLGDKLTGSGGDNIFRGLKGNDLIDGAAGSDTVDYSRDEQNGALTAFADGATGVIVNLTGSSITGTVSGSKAGSYLVAANSARDGFGDTDTLTGIESAIGTRFNDTLVGSNQVNFLTGGDGNDVMNGGLADDLLDGGTGIDTADYTSDTLGVGAYLWDVRDFGVWGIASFATGSGINVEYYRAVGGASTIENVNGGSAADTIQGNFQDNVLNGNGGGDSLRGLQGIDTISGGDGIDLLIGDEGNDTLNGGNDRDIMDGGADNDTLNGDGGNDEIYTGTGTDTVNGGAGSDIIYIVDTLDSINGGTETDYLVWNLTSAANLVITNAMSIEWAGGRDSADTINAVGISNFIELQGNGGDDTLIAGNGGSILLGGAGLDTLTGGNSTDHMVGFTEADKFRTDAGGGTDYVYDFVKGTDKLDLTLLSDDGIHGTGDLTVNTTYGVASGWWGYTYLGVNTIWVNTGVGNGALAAGDFLFA